MHNQFYDITYDDTPKPHLMITQLNYNPNKFINMGRISSKKKIASKIPSQNIKLIEQNKLMELMKIDLRKGFRKPEVESFDIHKNQKED